MKAIGKKNFIRSIVICLFFLFCTAGMACASGDTVTVTVKGKMDYQKAFEVLEYTNQLRKQVGAEPLKMDKELLNAAMQRAAETTVIFQHVRPDGTTCYTASDKMGGENIAAGQSSAASVVNSWKNSSGHYRNMIKGNYRSIGIGCFYYEGTYYWTQCFGREEAETVTRPANQTRAVPIQLYAGLLNEQCLTIAGTTGTLQKGDAVPLKLYFYYGGWTFKRVEFTWDYFTLSSQDPDIVAVTGAGQIRARNAGKTSLVMGHKELPDWKGILECTVTDANSRNVVLDANGGSLSKISSVKTQTSQVTYKQKYGSLPTPVRKGYTFLGWYTKKSGGIRITASKIVTIAKGKTQTLYAHWSKITVSKASISKVSKSGTNGVTVQWKKVSGAAGYEVSVSTSSKFVSGSAQVKLLTGGSLQSAAFTGLEKGKKYYCRVRAYKTDALGNRIYGKYSTVKTIKL